MENLADRLDRSKIVDKKEDYFLTQEYKRFYESLVKWINYEESRSKDNIYELLVI